MAFDKPTRNRLAAFVGNARDLIAGEYTQQFQSLYGISERGALTPLDQLRHLDEIGLATAATLRERIDYLVKSHPDDREGLRAAVDRLAREQAFTILNRMAAIRMAEKRGIIVESVGQGYQSKGFKVFEQVAGAGLGDTYHRYRRYLFCLFDELAVDLGVLFDRRSPHGLLFPREPVLLQLFGILNAPDLDSLWAEDETIGWIYQYYNDPAERKKMRDASSAPRNSRELAVRNQFFTPRYVVEFLTDNTLGRIWYEMTQGQTRLKEQCRYLVRRPNEIFLRPDETAPEQPQQEDLSQEQLLKQPVYIPHRPLKDPREIRMLDPACGSMHFGLYAFDLFEVIYDESWDLGMESLRRDYPDKDSLLREVPRLIIENNIHGIDIDPRAVQIAGLSLWLRAQRTWQQQKLRPQNRPQILRSNIVCAEAMPGDETSLNEFVNANLSTNPEGKLLGQLVRSIFEAMKLAGEAGSLLKIEEEIASAVAEAKKKWLAQPKADQGILFAFKPERPKQPALGFDVSGITDEAFWEKAEHLIYEALQSYAERAENGGGYRRRLFAEDAVRGFAFIDMCRKRYEVALMNPPFGDPPSSSNSYLGKNYLAAKHDLATAFLERCAGTLTYSGLFGSITTRTIYFLSYVGEWRERFLLSTIGLSTFCDLGNGVLDAMVETALLTSSVSYDGGSPNSLFFRISDSDNHPERLSDLISSANIGVSKHGLFPCRPSTFRAIPKAPFAYWVPDKIRNLFSRLPAFETAERLGHIGALSQDDFRFVRLWWEISAHLVGKSWTAGSNLRWVPYVKGGTYAPYYMDLPCLLAWANDGEELKAFLVAYRQALGFADQWTGQLNSYGLYFREGLTWSSRPIDQGSFWILPKGCIFRHSAPAIMDRDQSALLFDLGILNSTSYRFLLDLLMPRGSSGTASLKYELGYVRSVPIPEFSPSDQLRVADAALVCARAILEGYSFLEESHHYLKPILTNPDRSLAEAFAGASSRRHHLNQAIRSQARETDALASRYYGLSDNLGVSLLETSKIRGVAECISNIEPFRADAIEDQIRILFSYVPGCIYGRWDIRFATGAKPGPELPDPFASLPVCPPGQLQNDQGLPITKEDVARLKEEGQWNYPIEIPWNGILVDDPGHPRDIEARVQQVLQIIWKDRWEAIEREACEILGAKNLREYFRKPSNFFADHLKRYSKSRRQAPIYWPLSSTKGSYTLWIYYHRLTDQTLHTALADFLDPKLKAVRAEIGALRESGNHRARLEELLDLEEELADFRIEIERIIKLPWKPNLNDGVLVTSSPLWRLFRLPKWQKDLKACWEKLEKGEYDWTHLAYSIWPKRVEELCKTDRSVAIAHNLEHLYTMEMPKSQTKRKNKQAKEV